MRGVFSLVPPTPPSSARVASQSQSQSRRKPGRRGSLGLLAAVLVLGTIFGGPVLVRYLKAPAITESFGVEDAVVALRLEARDISYLVLVNEAGETRSVRLAERGFEEANLAWSAAGINTGDPSNEYLLRDTGLVRMKNPNPLESASERQRLITDSGFVVLTGSARGQQMAFVDAKRGSTRVMDAAYVNPRLASCGDAVVMVDEAGVTEVTADTGDFDGFGMFDGVEALACAGDGVYALGAASEGANPVQSLRVWQRSGGGPKGYQVRYPGAITSPYPSSLFAYEGRLYWAAGYRLWSVEAPSGNASESGETQNLEAVEAAELSGNVSTGDARLYDTVVGTSEGTLAVAGSRVFSVTADETWIKPRRGNSYDKLNGMAIASTDVRTGERRIEIEIDDPDFPHRDLRVRAVAVDPEWAATR